MTVAPPRPTPDETGTTKSAYCHLVTSCEIWCGAPTKHPIKQVYFQEFIILVVALAEAGEITKKIGYELDLNETIPSTQRSDTGR